MSVVTVELSQQPGTVTHIGFIMRSFDTQKRLLVGEIRQSIRPSVSPRVSRRQNFRLLQTTFVMDIMPLG